MKFSELKQGSLVGYNGEVISYNRALKLIQTNSVEYPMFTITSESKERELRQAFEDYQNNVVGSDFAILDYGEKIDIDVDRLNDIEKVKQYIIKHPNYKVSEIQRLLMKGYAYCYKILEKIGER